MSGGSSGPEALLRSLTAVRGQPVRVTVSDPVSHERVHLLSGVLSRTRETGLTVDCLNALPALPANAPITVEVMVNGNVFWWHTLLMSGGGAGRGQLQLELPDAVESTQRRRHPRVVLDMTVHLLLKQAEATFAAVIRDISAGGASVWTEAEIPESTRLNLVFTLGSGLYFRDLEARVIRCTAGPEAGYIVALQFQCDQGQEAALTEWVDRQLQAGQRGFRHD